MKAFREIAPLQVAEGLANGKFKASEIFVDRGQQIIALENIDLCFSDFHKFTYYIREVSE